MSRPHAKEESKRRRTLKRPKQKTNRDANKTKETIEQKGKQKKNEEPAGSYGAQPGSHGKLAELDAGPGPTSRGIGGATGTPRTRGTSGETRCPCRPSRCQCGDWVRSRLSCTLPAGSRMPGAGDGDLDGVRPLSKSSVSRPSAAPALTGSVSEPPAQDQSTDATSPWAFTSRPN